MSTINADHEWLSVDCSAATQDECEMKPVPQGVNSSDTQMTLLAHWKLNHITISINLNKNRVAVLAMFQSLTF